MTITSFNPHQWVQPTSQSDIVKANYGNSPYTDKETTIKTPGLTRVIENITTDPDLFKASAYNAMRLAPILREFEFIFGDFGDAEVTVQTNKQSRLAEGRLEAIATTFAHELARDNRIIRMYIDAQDSLVVTKLKEKTRLDEDVAEKADPHFRVAYTIIS